jgi:hypothetical protein
MSASLLSFQLAALLLRCCCVAAALLLRCCCVAAALRIHGPADH